MADAGTTPDVPVVIDGAVIVEFNEASSRQQINSGESVKTLFGKIRKFLTDLKAVAFSGSYADLSDTPESLPANGGNADTVGGFRIWAGTQAQFNAIASKDANTLYIIKEG